MPGVAGQGLRVCGLRARGVHACGCGVGVRAGVFALARALAVQLTTAALSATGIRKRESE